MKILHLCSISLLMLLCFVGVPFFVVHSGTITVYKEFLPREFMLVDKQKQMCYLYGARSSADTPLAYACSSGQVDGDKIIEGDKKTPEGVYFVTGSILEGLDFQEYGSRAYPLDYPNPIDILEKKTGYGIWVHGKGKAFETKSTRGCVAFPEKDILKLYTNFMVSYPVVIADTIQYETSTPSKKYNAIARAITEWAQYWTDHSSQFFARYDASKRSNYTAFVKNKKAVFAHYPFTYVSVEQPNIVRKNQYYTTWFRQFYYAPNLLVEGTRYLYWEMDKDNVPKIVAEAWKPDTTPSTKSRLEKRIMPSVQAFLENWKKYWEDGNLVSYTSLYASNAQQGSIKGISAIAIAKKKLWKKAVPKNVDIQSVTVALTKKGIRVNFIQTYTANGYKDRGQKTLYIIPSSSEITGWKITEEIWVPIR